MDIPFITASDVRLNWPDIVSALERGHRAARPEISDQFLHRGDDTLLSRAAWIDGLGVAVKSVTVMPKSTPSVQGAMLVFNDQSGAIEAVIDSALVTKWKTIGDSLLGAKLLARPESKKLLVIGAGTIAEGLLEAYPTLFPGLEIDLWNRTEETAIALARKHPRTRAISDLPAAVGKADIIATATMSHQPVLSGAWLRAGQHIDLIGAFTAEMREADDTALQRSRIFVDSRATTVGHIGELMIPLASGAISEADICGDYYDLVAGGQGRTSATEITLCKNGGGAHLDLMVGREILAAYRAQST